MNYLKQFTSALLQYRSSYHKPMLPMTDLEYITFEPFLQIVEQMFETCDSAVNFRQFTFYKSNTYRRVYDILRTTLMLHCARLFL